MISNKNILLEMKNKYLIQIPTNCKKDQYEILFNKLTTGYLELKNQEIIIEEILEEIKNQMGIIDNLYKNNDNNLDHNITNIKKEKKKEKEKK